MNQEEDPFVPAFLAGWNPKWVPREPVMPHLPVLGRVTKKRDPRGGVRTVDITGKTFGHLEAIGRDEQRGGTYWRFRCSCGRIVSATAEHIRRPINGVRACDARRSHHGL